MKHNRFQTGRGVYACTICARQTRGPDGVHIDLCGQCFDLAGIENEVSDGHRTTAAAKIDAAEILADCIARGGNEASLRTAFADLI